MKWKNFPYWLKGGIIGVPIGFLLLVIANYSGVYNVLSFMFLMILIMAGGGLEGQVPWGKYTVWFITLLITGAIFFSIGALIGLIVQKIKKK